MTRVAATVRAEKAAHPERFCANPKCLWREMRTVPGGSTSVFLCPKHRNQSEVERSKARERAYTPSAEAHRG